MKNTTYNEYHIRIWSPTNKRGSGTFWFANRQDKHSTKERMSTYSSKESVTLVLSLTFIDMFWIRAYHQIGKVHWAYLNNDAIANTSKKGKWSPSLILGRPTWIAQRPAILVLTTPWQNLSNSRNVTPNLTSNQTLYLRLEKSKGSNCWLL